MPASPAGLLPALSNRECGHRSAPCFGIKHSIGAKFACPALRPTPLTLLFDEHMSVAAMCPKRRCAEVPAHLSAAGYHSRRLVEANPRRVKTFNGFNLELTGTNCIKPRGLGDFRPAH